MTDSGFRIPRLPLLQFRHLIDMPGADRHRLRSFATIVAATIIARTPAEPAPPPIKEPVDPPESPDAPVREPDPEEPAQI